MPQDSSWLVLRGALAPRPGGFCNRAARLRSRPPPPMLDPGRAAALICADGNDTAWRMTQRIEIVEVGPRDGLQSEPGTVATSVKIEFIERAIACGLRRIEVTSFVNPQRVPQMADA